MLLQGMPLEYKGDIDPASYIKCRCQESQGYCSIWVLGNENRAIITLLLRAESSPEESAGSLCEF